MNKETVKSTTNGLLGVTAAGATEGAIITSFFGPPPASTIAGGLFGGALAFTGEVSRRGIVSLTRPPQEPVVADPVDRTTVDVKIQTTSTTTRTDVKDAQPIVKSHAEQASGVAVSDLTGAIASLRERAYGTLLPTWSTNVQERIVTSATHNTAYEHVPHQVAA